MRSSSFSPRTGWSALRRARSASLWVFLGLPAPTSCWPLRRPRPCRGPPPWRRLPRLVLQPSRDRRRVPLHLRRPRCRCRCRSRGRRRGRVPPRAPRPRRWPRRRRRFRSPGRRSGRHLQGAERRRHRRRLRVRRPRRRRPLPVPHAPGRVPRVTLQIRRWPPPPAWPRSPRFRFLAPTSPSWRRCLETSPRIRGTQAPYVIRGSASTRRVRSAAPVVALPLPPQRRGL